MRYRLCLAFSLCTLIAGGTRAADLAAEYRRAESHAQRMNQAAGQLRIQPIWCEDGARVRFQVGEQHFAVDARTGERSSLDPAKLPPADPKPPRDPAARPAEAASNPRSPDGQWQLTIRGHDLVATGPAAPQELRLSSDGKPTDRFTERCYWSPDSRKCIVLRLQPGGDRKVTLVESAPQQQLQPLVKTIPYLKPGDPIDRYRPYLFDAAQRTLLSIDTALFDNPWDISRFHWDADSQRFLFLYNQRGHQVMRVIAIDAGTGRASSLVDEVCPTFFDYSQKTYLRYLADGDLLWASERSGYNHLYRIDGKSGKVKNAVTAGSWVLRNVVAVDERQGTVTFRLMGYYPSQDPYFTHFAKVKMDGTGLTLLTEADGTHEATFSADRRYFVDEYSRVDRLPRYELRSAETGKRIAELFAASSEGLRTAGWRAPEPFVAAGRDGKTAIHGAIFRPSEFDPARRYPVVEYIYAGPHNFHVPKAFSTTHFPGAFAEYGFIVVMIDGMGTNWRSKAFHDVCWKNLGDSGFPDRIAWIKAAAAKYPEMDITKGVGIFGGSAGGQSALRGMTEYPEFYTVGSADCGCHDNRMDKIWWNEAWMGWPVGPHYAEQSNVTNAHKLRGKLLLFVGELDTNVDPASTLQVVSALIKANKDFDMLLLPGVGHGSAETPYGKRKRADFFVRHLRGLEPPPR